MRPPRSRRLALAAASAVALVLAVAGLAVAAGPPFPPPVNGQAVYDTADALRGATVEQVEATIDAIEQRTGAEIAVYTQLTPCCEDTPTAEHNAQALMDQWGVGRKGFDDGLVILFDLNADDPCHGQVQLYAGPGFSNEFLTNSDRQKIYEDDMLPLLERCDLDGALLVAMEKIDAAATPEHARDARLLPAAQRGPRPARRAAAVRAARRRRADVVVPPRARPRLPRRPVDPHPGAARRPDAGRRGGHPRWQVVAPGADDGEPRPRVARPDRVRGGADRPDREEHRPVDPNHARLAAGPGGDPATRAGQRATMHGAPSSAEPPPASGAGRLIDPTELLSWART